MSSTSSDYSFNKYNLIKGLIIGIIIFVLGYLSTFSIYTTFTLNFIFNKAHFYLKDIEKFEQMSEEERSNIGLNSVIRMIKHLNMSFFSYKDSEQKTLKDKLTLKWAPKLYLILTVCGTIIVLLKLIVNFTINSIISTTINSSVEVTPHGYKNKFKPDGNIVSSLFQMFLIYLKNILILVIPTVFVYVIYNVSLFTNFYNWVKILISLIVFIGVLIYIYYNIFSKGFSISRDPDTSLSSSELDSENVLKGFFNSQDYDYVNKIYDYKDSFAGIWIVVAIIFLTFEYKHLNNIKVKAHNRFIKFLNIGIVLLMFAIYLCYRNYITSTNSTANYTIFDNKGDLVPEMYKKSVNNIYQAIVKYNYPCMPFNDNIS